MDDQGRRLTEPQRSDAPQLSFGAAGRFRVVAPLGRGASGVVHRVVDQETGSTVALKCLEALVPDEIYRLKQEFRALADTRHANLVELYELFVADRDCFFTMELVDGPTVVEFVRGDWRDGLPGPSGVQRLLACATQLVAGVAALHAAGQLHRDIKPSNVLVASREQRVVLLDFGFAIGFGPGRRNYETGGLAGTAAYMAPEYFWGAAPAPAGDWYGVGALLYECVAGAPPFADLPLARRVQESATLAVAPLRTAAPWLPESVDALVRALLDPEPARRPGADEALARLATSTTGARRPMRRAATSPHFVGRAAELARLRAAQARVGDGHPVLVRVHGESGVGKSELVRRFLDEVSDDDGTVVLSGRCHPQEAVPYRAFDRLVDALSGYLAQLPEAAVGALRPRRAAELLQLFPVLRRVPALADGDAPVGDADPREIRRRGFGALRELLARIGDRARLVLWIDDLQWSGDDSAALARELLRAPEAPSLLLLVSLRGEHLGRVPFLMPFEGGADGIAIDVEDIAVGPLSAVEAGILALQLGVAETADLGALVAESGGSPLFVAQLAHHLAAEPGGGARSLSRAGLDAVLGERFEALSATGRALLETACTAGEPLDRRVILRAAGVGEQARSLIRHLEQDRLLRSAPLERAVGIEAYHDRVREFVLARLAGDRLIERHRQLGEVLAEEPAANPESVFGHFRAAGARTQAAIWGRRAAERADAALAFADAARLYTAVLDLVDAHDPGRRDLLVRCAEALVNAGRGSDAAPRFLAAAALASGTEQLDLRRRGAEQYLVSGHLDDGAREMQAVVAALGLRYPRSTAAGAFGVLRRLLRLRLVGLQPRRPSPAVGALDQLRVETCHSAAKGLAMVDPFRGLYFAVSSVNLALGVGDERRTARGLASLGAALLPAGGPLERWAARMLVEGRAVAERTRDPYLCGFTAITGAQQSMLAGRWREMLASCDAGVAQLRDTCRGVTWETDIGTAAAVRALEELGDYRELGRRAEQLRREAEDAGDLYGTVIALLTLGLARLAAGDVAGARAAAQRVMALWTPTGFHMQHLYALRLQAAADLYEGDAAAAWARIEHMWPDLQRSNLLRHALLRLDAHLLRARAALALAVADPTETARALRRADADAAVVAGIGPHGKAYASLVQALMAAVRGDRAAAQRGAGTAAREFSRLEMAPGRGYASWIAADRSTDTSPIAEELRTCGVADPASFGRLYAPGAGWSR